MSLLYDHLSYLPDFMQRPIATILLIVVGYFLSKILAATIAFIIPKRIAPEDGSETDVKPLRLHISKIAFWFSWLIFIAIGLNQIHPSLLTPSNYTLKPTNYLKLFAIVICAFMLLLNERRITDLSRPSRNFVKSMVFSEQNAAIRLARRVVWILIFGLFFIAMGTPGSLSNKVAMTLILLSGGWLLSNVTKQTVGSIFELFGRKDSLFPKFLGYLTVAHFIFVAVAVWR